MLPEGSYFVSTDHLSRAILLLDLTVILELGVEKTKQNKQTHVTLSHKARERELPKQLQVLQLTWTFRK